MSTILITGGAGMIGSNLTKRLASEGQDVIVVDNLWRGKLENLKNNDDNYFIDIGKKFLNLDLSQPEMLDRYLDKIDYVYHLADIVAGIGFVIENEGFIFRQNLLINSNVINSIRKFPNLKGFIYVGTACSFPKNKQNGLHAPLLTEDDQYPANPESAYGWSKLMGEYETLLMEKEIGLPVSVLVFHNVYGFPCDFGKETSQVIPALIRKAILFPKEPFVVWGSGGQGRTFVYIDDVVDALIKVKETGLGQGTIQIGPNKCTSIKELAEKIVNISGKNIEIQYDLSKPEGDKGRCADYSKAKKILNWSPKTKLADGLVQTYSWIESQF